jgi:hypothetical protein
MIAAALGLSLFTSACGNARGHGVASLASTSAANPTGHGGPSASPAAYATCMTAHGVAMAPPTSHHGLTILGNTAPNSTQFQAAERACQKLAPAGGPEPLTPAEQAHAAEALVRFATCMRKHEVPDFPDPNAQDTFPEAQIEALDTSSPAFQEALRTCDQLYPTRTAPQIAFPGGGHT